MARSRVGESASMARSCCFQGGDPLAQDGGHGGAVTRLGGLQLARGRLGACDEGFQAAAFTLDGGKHRADLTGGRAGFLALEALEESHGELLRRDARLQRRIERRISIYVAMHVPLALHR